MTVSGETSTVAAVDRDAADALFTEIYAAYWDRVRRFIWTRLDVSQAQLAEDLANETFIDLWQGMLKGRHARIEHPFSLLAFIARTKIADYLSLMKNGERSVDLQDPKNQPVVERGHSYAYGTPVLAQLSEELDQAMERMTAASDLWRDLHKQAHRCRQALSDGYRASTGGVTPEARRQYEQTLEAAEHRQALALEQLQQACARVGVLRLELEAVGGPNWKSSAGMPASAAKNGNSRETALPTHCGHGHRMDLNNTHFFADGSRRCRICMDTAAKNHALKTRGRSDGTSANRTVSPELIDAARQMLADPAAAGLSLAEIGRRVGVSDKTLRNRIPNHRDLRPRVPVAC